MNDYAAVGLPLSAQSELQFCNAAGDWISVIRVQDLRVAPGGTIRVQGQPTGLVPEALLFATFVVFEAPLWRFALHSGASTPFRAFVDPVAGAADVWDLFRF